MKNRALTNAIALIRVPPDTNSLAEALDLWHGLQHLSSKTQILIKPNFVLYDDFRPFTRRSFCPRRFGECLEESGVEIDMEDYLRYRKHLVERYKAKPQFDPKDFFERER